MNRRDKGLGFTLRSGWPCLEPGCSSVFFDREALWQHLDHDHPAPWTWVDYALIAGVVLAAGLFLFTLGLCFGWWPL